MDAYEVKISVIIPVYNCKKYISQCLNSVLNQTIKKLEIICVDDGSTDESASVVQLYAKKDKRITLLQQENKGAGVARNTGLQYAKGKFVSFLDADDYYVDSDALDKMIAQCEKNNVEVCGSYSLKEEKGIKSQLSFWGERNQNLVTDQEYYYRDFQFDYGYVTFIYNRKFLASNAILFPSYRRFEDPPFLVQALNKAKKFVMADTNLYCYRIPNIAQRCTSMKVADMLLGIMDNLKYAKEYALNTLFERTLQRIEYEYCDVILHNLPGDDTTILERLVMLNGIIQEFYIDKKFIVRPLRVMVEGIQKEYKCYEEILLNEIKQNDQILIYGAGRFCKALLRYLKEKKVIGKVAYIIVSSIEKEQCYVEGIPIISIQEAKGRFLYSTKVFIAAGGLAQKEIIDILNQYGYLNYELMDNIFLSELDL